MSRYSIGGWTECSAVLVFNTWFLWSLVRACPYHFEKDTVREKRWMVRAVGVLLGIATTRPVVGVFFATSSATHLTPQQFFGIAFWIGFSVNTTATELWLGSRCRRKRLSSSLGIMNG